MTSKIKQTLCTAAAGAMLAALLAAPAQAAAPHLTPDSTVAELHGNEGIVGSGFDSWDRGTLLPEQPWEYPRWSLRRYIGAPVDDAVAALNLVIDNYNQGVQVTYPLYMAEEIAADPTRASAELYYFPAKQPGARYALVLSGNMMERTARIKEGCSAVAQLHEMGYAAFILNYRVGRELKDNANYQDLVRAVQYITAHAGELQVDP
ncbi:MAG TPA: alpha/beta hydrolase, partial [Candidatus Faecalibacterium gallistercoris]|nr:alpha/beta hydrolase [Candidatus Faecalibacterium gallistercoris]